MRGFVSCPNGGNGRRGRQHVFGGKYLTEAEGFDGSWQSKKIKGLYENDFIMAAMTDQLFDA